MKLLEQLKKEGLDDQFHPSYTRMVPAHHVVEIQLLGCPDPNPVYTRYFTPEQNVLSTNSRRNWPRLYRRARGCLQRLARYHRKKLIPSACCFQAA